MSTVSPTHLEAPRRRSTLLRGLAIGLVIVVAGGLLAGCATTPAWPARSRSRQLRPRRLRRADLPTALSEPAATAALAEAASTPAPLAEPNPGCDAGCARRPWRPWRRHRPRLSPHPLSRMSPTPSLSPTQKLDLYLPEGEGPFPVIITVHGGGFMMGDKADATAPPAPTSCWPMAMPWQPSTTA